MSRDIRRRQEDDANTPEGQHSKQPSPSQAGMFRVYRDDRPWTVNRADWSPSNINYPGPVPGPPFVAMTLPIEAGPQDIEGQLSTLTPAMGGYVPVLAVDAAPIDGTYLVARQGRSYWFTDDAFSGYYQVVVGNCASQPYGVYVSGDDPRGSVVTLHDTTGAMYDEIGTVDHLPYGYTTYSLSFGGTPTAGSFVIGYVDAFGGTWTAPALPWNATATQVAAAMNAARPAISPDLVATGGPLPGTPIIFENPPNSGTIQANNLVGGSTSTVYRIAFGGRNLGGTFTLTFSAGPLTTAAIPYDATAAQIQAALESLSTIGVGNVRVTDSFPSLGAGPWWIEFANTLEVTNRVITIDGSSLTGDSVTATSTKMRQGVRCPIAVTIDTKKRTAPVSTPPYDPEPVYLPFRTRGPFNLSVVRGAKTASISGDRPKAGLARRVFFPGPGSSTDKVCTCLGGVGRSISATDAFGTHIMAINPPTDPNSFYFINSSLSGFSSWDWRATYVAGGVSGALLTSCATVTTGYAQIMLIFQCVPGGSPTLAVVLRSCFPFTGRTVIHTTSADATASNDVAVGTSYFAVLQTVSPVAPLALSFKFPVGTPAPFSNAVVTVYEP